MSPDTIPPELASAPALAVAELLAAESAIGHGLPALRAILAAAAPPSSETVSDTALARWLGYQAHRLDRVDAARCLVSPSAMSAYDEGAALGDSCVVRIRLPDAAKRRWTRRIAAL